MAHRKTFSDLHVKEMAVWDYASLVYETIVKQDLTASLILQILNVKTENPIVDEKAKKVKIGM